MLSPRLPEHVQQVDHGGGGRWDTVSMEDYAKSYMIPAASNKKSQGLLLCL